MSCLLPELLLLAISTLGLVVANKRTCEWHILIPIASYRGYIKVNLRRTDDAEIQEVALKKQE